MTGQEHCFKHPETPASYWAYTVEENAPVCGLCAVEADGLGVEVFWLDGGKEMTDEEWDKLVDSVNTDD